VPLSFWIWEDFESTILVREFHLAICQWTSQVVLPALVGRGPTRSGLVEYGLKYSGDKFILLIVLELLEGEAQII